MSKNPISEILYLDRIKNDWSRCSRCKFEGSIKFFKTWDLKLKYPYCIECRKISVNISRPKTRAMSIKKKFGISIGTYNDLLKKQKNKCGICKKEESFVNCHTGKIIALALDHCHKTGQIRGILCRNCNLMIGNAKDSIKILRAAIRYLQNKHSLLLSHD